MASAIGEQRRQPRPDSARSLTPDLGAACCHRRARSAPDHRRRRRDHGRDARHAPGPRRRRSQAMTNRPTRWSASPTSTVAVTAAGGRRPATTAPGFVSAVLHAGGYLSQPQTTVTLPQQPGMESGPGQYVTVYDRALPGEQRPRDHRHRRPVLRVRAGRTARGAVAVASRRSARRRRPTCRRSRRVLHPAGL